MQGLEERCDLAEWVLSVQTTFAAGTHQLGMPHIGSPQHHGKKPGGCGGMAPAHMAQRPPQCDGIW